MNASQLLLQLGVSGAIIWAVVKLGLRFIDRWSAAEDKRTEILSASLGDITKSVSGVHVSQARIEGKIDVAMGWTPVQNGVPAPAGDEDTNPQSPHAIEAQSAPRYPRPVSQPYAHHSKPNKRR